MKLILAYISKDHFPRVYDELLSIHIHGLSVSEVEGFGQEHDTENPDFQEFVGIEMTKKIRLEIFCHDHESDKILESIYKAAHTGLSGNGKVFVIPVEDALRLKTGERGDLAISPKK